MRKFLLAAMLMLAFCGSMLADGSDPIPFCRNQRNEQCPKVIPAPPLPALSFDGGPGPICPPKQQCPWTAEVAAPAAVTVPVIPFVISDTIAFDGGPIPMCSPKCKWSPEHCTFNCPEVLPKKN